jgi:type I restriction enzyme S subunit
MAASKPSVEQLITDNIDVWTSAIKKRGSQGRGSNKKIELHGINVLRLLILELAFSGRLTDPCEENANDLLANLSSIKDDLIRKKVLKQIKSSGKVEQSEVRLSIPAHWTWTRLGEVFDVRDGTHDSPKYQSKGYPLVTSKNIYSGTLDLTNIKYISKEDHLKISERSKVDRGDILFAMIGSIGNPVIIDVDPEFSVKNVGLFKYYDLKQSNPKYLQYFLMIAEKWFKEEASGAVQSFVSLGKLRGFPFPLAPLKDQGLIVAKVDELMALCDQLEQQTESSLSAHQTLVETLLNTLLTAAQTSSSLSSSSNTASSASPQATGTKKSNSQVSSRQTSSFDQAWNRIAQHFDVLFTTEHSIDQLKQTILQLAVMGKLVPQDPNDEPASVLLEKIAAEKEQLIKDGKIKKQKPLPEISEDEKPFALPRGWEWCRLSSLATFENGDRSSKYPNKGDLVDNGIPFFGAPDIKSGKLAYSDDLRFISAEKFSTLSNGKLVDRDFVMLLRGTVGKVAQYHSNESHSTGFINAQMLIIRLIDSEIDSYLAKFFTSNVFRQDIGDKISGAVIRQIPASAIAEIKIPLPPEKERTKIGVRVDELMALCDTLKKRISKSQTTQLHLADTMAEQALNE